MGSTKGMVLCVLQQQNCLVQDYSKGNQPGYFEMQSLPPCDKPGIHALA